LQRSRESEKRRNDAKRKPRYCDTCGAELPVYWGNHSRHCDICRPLYKKELARAKRLEYAAEGRTAEYQRRYKVANPDQVRESARRWRQAHPEEGLAAIHRRRVRVDAGNLDALDRLLSTLYRKAIKGDPCFYCGTSDTQCVDHYFAIAKGGSDRWFNLVRACRKCNLSKRTMCGTAFLLLTGG
jgi:5-methylcytosine-specific restriction endonuclease McrA